MSDANFVTETLSRVLQRRKTLQDALDAVLSAPASYNIQGSYSQTSQSPDELRAEIARCDRAIEALTGQGGGIRRTYPSYIEP